LEAFQAGSTIILKKKREREHATSRRTLSPPLQQYHRHTSQRLPANADAEKTHVRDNPLERASTPPLSSPARHAGCSSTRHQTGALHINAWRTDAVLFLMRENLPRRSGNLVLFDEAGMHILKNCVETIPRVPICVWMTSSQRTVICARRRTLIADAMRELMKHLATTRTMTRMSETMPFPL